MELPKRKLQRLPGFNYSSVNYYYVTVCTHEKSCIFGSANTINAYGVIAEEELLTINNRYSDVFVDKYVVMPNHIHAIVVIGSDGKESLSKVIGNYKAGVSRTIHKSAPNLTVWQKSFYDHIIRGDDEYKKICSYIEENRNKLQCIINGEI